MKTSIEYMMDNLDRNYELGLITDKERDEEMQRLIGGYRDANEAVKWSKWEERQ